jgi:hypothetical protein
MRARRTSCFPRPSRAPWSSSTGDSAACCPSGSNLGQLLVGLAHAGQSDPAALPDIDAAIFPAYLEGLAAEDYQVPPDRVRLGYLGGLAARSALAALPLELLSGPPSGQAQAQFLHRLRLTRALLDLTAAATIAQPAPATAQPAPAAQPAAATG